MDAISAIAAKHGIPVIEDCAQAPGARYKDKFAGTLADLGVYSLNFHKHIHTGEGGVIVTDNDELAERCRLIRNHAEAAVGKAGVTDLTNMVGSNFRLTEIQAAIGRAQLSKLKELTDQRIKNCEYLNNAISEIPGLRPARVRLECTHVY